MAKVGKRSPTPQATPRRVSPLKPGLRSARNYVTAQMRAASYSRAGAIRMSVGISMLVMAVLITGLWLGGFMPNIRQGGADFTKSRLMAMGFSVQNVDVIGEGRIREEEVFAALGVNQGDYIFDINMREAQLRVQSLSWIDDAIVRRLWPDSIVVHIVERQPIALWQHDSQVHVVDASSAIIEAANPQDFAQLPLIVGNEAAANSRQIYEALATSPSVMAHIDAIIHIGERRWDIKLKDDRPRLMLPEDNPQAALALVEKLQRSHLLLERDISAIDLRVKNRLVLKPRPSAPKSQRSGGSAA